MKKLLSLPPNLVPCFHEVGQVDKTEWFCTADPAGMRIGSGGGTTWLLESCYRNEQTEESFQAWLSREKRILIHAGGLSRRLPAYAPTGKILTPVPVFRWERGQRLSQDLLSLQYPFYEQVLKTAPDNLHTLVASGDIYIRHTQPLQDIPPVDVACFGLWVEPTLAMNHGVFVCRRETPEQLDYMLQKPSLSELGTLSGSHFFLMDIGVWLLSDRAVELLRKRSYDAEEKNLQFYDMYGTFGLALGERPVVEDPELQQLSVAILPLPGGEFYHYGTSSELISSTLAIQNQIHDQRRIIHRKIKPHPAIFVQNARIEKSLTADNANVWIENSHIGAGWQLHNHHILTGIPENCWQLDLPAGICLDIVPIDEDAFAVRPYGLNDRFTGDLSCRQTLFLGEAIMDWAARRDVLLPVCDDLQFAPLFPVCSLEELEVVVRWMIYDNHSPQGKALWEKAEKLSASALADRANLARLVAQRNSFRNENWTLLAQNHEQSVFYQLDLEDAARAFVKEEIILPPPLDAETPLLKQMHDHMFRARVLQLSGKPYEAEKQQAFSVLREGLIDTLADRKQDPCLAVYKDQIVWGRSPVRIDLAGGWTDTPPFCLYAGGNVVNVAIELNGQPPLQVYVKPAKENKIILRSIDQGAMEEVTTWEELRQFTQIGSPFCIPKAALGLSGFLPEFASTKNSSLQEQLAQFGCGIEVTLLAAIPAGSGLGTSSILSATVLGALSDFCGLGWDKNEIGHRTLILEQLLTTGGGWQDQYGGILHGLKLLQTNDGFLQQPIVRWLPEYMFTNPEYQACHLLYYTGMTRIAKNILAEIVQGMFLNNHDSLSLLAEMQAHALELYKVIQNGDFALYGKLVGKSWELNKTLDSGTNPSAIEALIRLIKDYCLGYKLPGAGGGGYLYMVAKDPEAAVQIRKQLSASPLNVNARFVEMNLSTGGLQVSRS